MALCCSVLYPHLRVSSETLKAVEKEHSLVENNEFCNLTACRGMHKSVHCGSDLSGHKGVIPDCKGKR